MSTTCGSGSEVTPYTVINNSNTLRKFTLSSDLIYAKEAAINPKFLVDLPPQVKLNTALDAFIHCLEAILNKSSSALTYPLSYEGLKIGAKNMKKIYSYDNDLVTLQNAAKLSLFGGISIAHSRTGLIHTLSVAIAKFADIPHGRLNAQVLPFALDHNKTDGNGSLSKLVSSSFNKTFKNDKMLYLSLKMDFNFIDYSDFQYN